jgi:hypothetical protein
MQESIIVTSIIEGVDLPVTTAIDRLVLVPLLLSRDIFESEYDKAIDYSYAQ